MSNRELEEQMGRNADEKVARYLGLTYDEYCVLEPTVEEMAGDDGLIYGYLVIFDAAIPHDIAVKIQHLVDDEVSLPPGFFELEGGVPDWPQG